MKREKRPFKVEIRRGGKRAAPGDQRNTETRAAEPVVPFDYSLPPVSGAKDEAIRRAEAALFGERKPVVEPDAAASALASRRILESLDAIPDPVQQILAAEPDDAPAPKKRGRKPGSKNRPKEERQAASQAGVRRLQLTPELVNSALQTIAREAPRNEPRSATEQRTFDAIRNATALNFARADAPPKRRGRPPKIRPALPEGQIAEAPRRRGRPPRNPALQPVAMARTPVPVAAPEVVASTPRTLAPVQRLNKSRSQIVARYVYETQPKPGERWKRRLRSRD